MSRKRLSMWKIREPVARAAADWDWVDGELRRKGVTRMLLWQEYRSANPTGYSYTRNCELFREWRGLQGLSIVTAGA